MHYINTTMRIQNGCLIVSLKVLSFVYYSILVFIATRARFGQEHEKKS